MGLGVDFGFKKYFIGPIMARASFTFDAPKVTKGLISGNASLPLPAAQAGHVAFAAQRNQNHRIGIFCRGDLFYLLPIMAKISLCLLPARCPSVLISFLPKLYR